MQRQRNSEKGRVSSSGDAANPEAHANTRTTERIRRREKRKLTSDRV